MAVDPNDLAHAAQHTNSWAGWFVGGAGAIALLIKKISASWATDEKNAIVAQTDAATYERLTEQIDKLQSRIDHLEAVVMLMTTKDINARTCAAEMLQLLSTMCFQHCGGAEGGPADRLMLLAKAILTGIPPEIPGFTEKGTIE